MKVQVVPSLLFLNAAHAFSNSVAFSVSKVTKSQLHISTNSDVECTRRQSLGNLFFASVTLASVSPAFAREEYLTEPTEEFKESERLREDFRRKQLEIKREFNKVLDRLTFESTTEDQLINDLVDLKKLVIYTEGLPLGIKREELVKIIRAKKAKGFWPTNVEIAYQNLTREISYQQSPNKDKDVANPL